MPRKIEIEEEPGDFNSFFVKSDNKKGRTEDGRADTIIPEAKSNK